MSRAAEPSKAFSLFGNPFKLMSPKGSNLSSKLLDLLNTFEKNLTERLIKLRPKQADDVLSLSWMKLAIHALCETHSDITNLITSLELPVCDWDDKWIDIYLSDSVKLLDICNAFSSELSRLRQGNLSLQYALLNLKASADKLVQARSSLDSWRQHISSKNPRLENCFTFIDGLAGTLGLPKIKNSAKGKVLMRAMYGVKLQTVFICSILASVFSGSGKKLIELQVPDTFLWAESFTDLQSFINGKMRNMYGTATVLKEIEAVDAGVKKLYPLIQSGECSTEAETFGKYILELGSAADNLSLGLDHLTNDVDGFFQIVLGGRDALLSNLRMGVKVSVQVQGKIVKGLAVW